MDAYDARLEPFLEATASTLRDMAGVEVATLKAERAYADLAGDEVKAVIRLIAKREGCLMLSLSGRHAETLTRKILEVGDVAPRSDLISDALGEVANVIAGQTKAMLYGTPGHYTLGTPVVGVGPAATPDGERWVVDFAGEDLNFRIHLWLPGDGTVTP